MALDQGGTTPVLQVATPRVGQRAVTTFRRFAQAKPLGMAGALVLALMGVITVLAPLIAPYDPLDASFARTLPVSGEHWLGTDPLGRDVFSRVIMGSRISIYVGIVSVFIGVSLGAFIGIVTAYAGGILDLVVQRFVDAIQAFPGLVLAMAIMVTLGQSINNVIIAIAILLIPGGARIIRGSALSIKEQTYIDSARAVGCSHIRIMARHIFPNTIAPYIILNQRQHRERHHYRGGTQFPGCWCAPRRTVLGSDGQHRVSGIVHRRAWVGDRPRAGNSPSGLLVQPLGRCPAGHP